MAQRRRKCSRSHTQGLLRTPCGAKTACSGDLHCRRMGKSSRNAALRPEVLCGFRVIRVVVTTPRANTPHARHFASSHALGAGRLGPRLCFRVSVVCFVFPCFGPCPGALCFCVSVFPAQEGMCGLCFCCVSVPRLSHATPAGQHALVALTSRLRPRPPTRPRPSNPRSLRRGGGSRASG
jgi:hypothetical protein